MNAKMQAQSLIPDYTRNELAVFFPQITQMNAEAQTPYLVCEDLRYLRRCFLLIRRRCIGIFSATIPLSALSLFPADYTDDRTIADAISCRRKSALSAGDLF
jgi:hypothetical protein